MRRTTRRSFVVGLAGFGAAALGLWSTTCSAPPTNVQTPPRVRRIGYLSTAHYAGDPTQWNLSFGGLLAFGVNNAMVFRRAGQYVARILSGETPAAMPVEVPTHFHLIVNLKTAREQGLTIPQSVLSRATRVIE